MCSSKSRIPLFESMALLVAALAMIAALAGLFWPDGDGTSTVMTYRGQEVEIFGRGLYRDSSTFAGAGAQGTDVVTLLVAVPLLLLGLAMHRRGSIRGTLLMAGGLTWIVYAYASTSLGTVAYTDLFLLHVAMFGASLWSFILLLTSVDLRETGVRLLPGIPLRGLGTFLIASGAITAGIWLIEPVSGLVAGEYPELLGVSTTLFTHAFDMAVIAPAAIVTGVLVRAGRPSGYIFAVPMLILEALLAPAIIAQTIFQVRAGVEFSPVQMVVMIGGFLALAIAAIWMLVAVFRHIDDPVDWPTSRRERERALPA